MRADVCRISALLAQHPGRRRLNGELVRAYGVGYPRLVRMLREAGADVNGANRRGTTPLLAAVGSNDLRRAEILLKAKADSNREFTAGTPIWDRATPLMGAAASGDLMTARILVEAGLEINSTNYCAQAPLVHTKRLGRSPKPMIRFLKRHGATELTDDERALLRAGCGPGRESCVRLSRKKSAEAERKRRQQRGRHS